MGREQGLADAPCWAPVFPAEPAGHIHFVTNRGGGGGVVKIVPTCCGTVFGPQICPFPGIPNIIDIFPKIS